MLVGGVAVRLESRNQTTQPGRKNDEITGIRSGRIRVRHTSRHKYRGSGPGYLGAVGITEGQFTGENVPCFVVGMMDVKGGGAATSPLVYFETPAGGRESL